MHPFTLPLKTSEYLFNSCHLEFATSPRDFPREHWLKLVTYKRHRVSHTLSNHYILMKDLPGVKITNHNKTTV